MDHQSASVFFRSPRGRVETFRDGMARDGRSALVRPCSQSDRQVHAVAPVGGRATDSARQLQR